MARLIEKRKKLDAQLRENQLVQGVIIGSKIKTFNRFLGAFNLSKAKGLQVGRSCAGGTGCT